MKKRKNFPVSSFFSKLRFKRKKLPVLKCFSTLRSKLILAFLVPIAFIILLGLVSFQMASSGIGKKYRDTATQVIEMTGEYISFGLDNIENTSLEYINDKNVTNYISRGSNKDRLEAANNLKTIQNDLTVKSTVNDFILNIYIVSDSDKLLTSKSGYIFEADTYEKFLETKTGQEIKGSSSKPRWFGNETYLDEKLGTTNSEYALRLIQRYPNNSAFVVIDVDAKTIREILANTNLDESGVIAFVTKEGKEIAENNKEEIIFHDQAYYKMALNGSETQGSEYIQFKNETYLFMYSKIGKTDAMICALIPKTTITRQANSIKNITVVFVIIACVIAVLIGALISTGIGNTIRSIIAKLKCAAQGDLTVEFHTKRKDEFKLLIDEIQNTFTNTKELIRQVNMLSEVVSESSAGVNDTSALFIKSSEDISYAIKEIEQGIMQQAKDAEECLMQMDNLSKKIGRVSDDAKEISQITSSVKQSITEGTYCTQKLNQQTGSTIEITTDIVSAIEALEQKSKYVTQITHVINEIANQTNLLSLNASIEAARSGEQGKGFAVIAHEIRELARKSQESVDEIQKILKSIQDDTKTAAETAKKAESVLSLQENAVNNTITSFDNINDNVGKLMVCLNYITENVDSMEESRASTLGAIENISAVLEEIAASTSTVNQNAQNQISSVEALSESAGALSEHAEELSQAIQRFTV